MALRMRTSQAKGSRAAQRVAARPSRSLVAPVRAQEAAAPTAPKEEAKAAWTEPTLNPDTPSPIFGGSTGGLLNAAKVRYQ